MKKIFLNISLVSLLVLSASCDNFQRTDVYPTITVDHSSVTMFEGDEIQLTASPSNLTFKWSTSDESIATVDNSGLVKAIRQGSASILCESGDMSFETEIYVNKKVALTDVTMKCDSLIELAIGATVTIPVSMVPSDANDVPTTDFSWWSDDENVARVSQSGVVKGIGTGTTKIHYRKGMFSKYVTFDVQVTFPFVKGHPFVLAKDSTTVIWFRDFDRGGMNVAFYDTGGGGGNTYRAAHGDPTSSMVTIEGGGNIGYLASGEWYIYSISVMDAGTYEVAINASSGSSGPAGKYHFELDGEKITEIFPITGSGNWGTFIDEIVQITLPAGDHKLKFFADTGSHNPKHMTFTYISE
jgi:hypothetical protein